MQRCARCSNLALELFIQDFTGLSLRRVIRPTTAPSTRSFHHSTLSACASRQKTHTNVIIPRGPERRPISTSESTARVQDEAFSGTAGPAEEPVEINEVKRTTSSDNVPDPTAATQSRAQNRQQRKLRRIQEGKLAPRRTKQTRKGQPVIEPAVVEPLPDFLARTDNLSGFNDVLSSSLPSKTPSLPKQRFRPHPATSVHSTTPTPSSSPSSLTQPPPLPTSAKRQPKRGDNDNNNSSKAGDNKEEKRETQQKKKETWQVQKSALARKFGSVGGWQPRKRVSPDTMQGIRALHAADARAYPTAVLARHFAVTPEAIRRILKSRWRPTGPETEARMRRWERRGERKWRAMAALGVRPPAKWRALGIQAAAVGEGAGVDGGAVGVGGEGRGEELEGRVTDRGEGRDGRSEGRISRKEMKRTERNLAERLI